MRICVVRLGGMGDILLSTPAARALAQRYGTDQIDYVVGPGMATALRGIPYVREAIVFDRRRDAAPAAYAAFCAGLRARRYDLFVNFQPSAKTLGMMWLSGAPARIVFRKDRRVQTATGKVRHAIDDFLKELVPLGIADADRAMDFSVTPEDAAGADAILAAAGIAPDAPLVAMNPAGTRDINRWPPERFAGLSDALAQRLPGHARVLVGGPGDRELAATVAGHARAPLVDLSGRFDVHQLGATLRRASVFVTGDTGPLHIGAAVGARLVCLSGAADPDRTGPSNNPADLVVIRRDLDCVPCQDRRCRRGDIACMTGMPVEWVLEAALRRCEGAR